MSRVQLDKTALTLGAGNRLTLSPGKTLIVYDRGTTDEAQGFVADVGSTEVTYPLIAEADGRYTAFYEPGSYDLYTPGDDDTQPWEAVAGIDQTEVDSTITDFAVVREAPLNVKYPEFGAAGNGTTDDTTAIQDAATAASGSTLYFPAGNTFRITDTITIPGDVEAVILDGDIVKEGANAALEVEGSMGSAIALAADIAANNRTATVPDGSAFAVGDWVLVYSEGTVPGSTAKLGYLRRVHNIGGAGGDDLFLDSGVPRLLATADTALIRKITMARFVLRGSGTITNADPTDNVSGQTDNAINITFVENPVIDNIEIADWGRAAIRLNHCVGGYFDGYIHDLLDDEVTYFGYGINVTGATRSFDVRGRIGRCRHAATTNAGPDIAGLQFYGEPECNTFQPHAFATNDKALDTHREGWGNIMVPNIHGGLSGGINIRADKTIVRPGTIQGCATLGIHVRDEVEIAAQIVAPLILDTRGTDATGTGIVVSGPCRIIAPSIHHFATAGIRVDEDAGLVEIVSPFIDAVGNSADGIQLLGSGTRIVGGLIENCVTGIDEDAAATGNSWDGVRFDGNSADVSAAAYVHPKIATDGIVLSSGDVVIPNNEGLQFRASGGTPENVVSLNASNQIVIGNTARSILLDGTSSAAVRLRHAGTNRIMTDSTGIGFFNTTPIAKPTGVAVTAAGIHAALVSLGLIAA